MSTKFYIYILLVLGLLATHPCPGDCGPIAGAACVKSCFEATALGCGYAVGFGPVGWLGCAGIASFCAAACATAFAAPTP